MAAIIKSATCVQQVACKLFIEAVFPMIKNVHNQGSSTFAVHGRPFHTIFIGYVKSRGLERKKYI